MLVSSSCPDISRSTVKVHSVSNAGGEYHMITNKLSIGKSVNKVFVSSYEFSFKIPHHVITFKQRTYSTVVTIISWNNSGANICMLRIQVPADRACKYLMNTFLLRLADS